MTLPPLTLANARVLRPDGFCAAPLPLAEGRVAGQVAGRAIDLTGYMILPGLIDLHGDGFERHVAPRRGAQSDIGPGLEALDTDLAANGITTAVLAQFFSWEGGMRGPEFAEAVARALSEVPTITDMRIQLRLEINLIDRYPQALDLIRRAGIGYVVFNDHLPHKHLAAGKRPPRLTGQALKSGRSPESHWQLLRELHARCGEVPERLAELAATLQSDGVRLGSHDDQTGEDRARFRALGARIAEFPETLTAAAAAHAGGDPVLMGAPNVVRGGSHDKKVSACDVIAAGHCDALVSDYHYPTLRQAAFALADRGILPFAEAWALVSSRPAAVMGWTDRGHLDTGARADLVIVEEATRRVAATIAGGQISHLAGPMATRFL
ncbi:alpha-D-ribose 1-methylphosphonate 5-triphosphate diphosphatase [Nioella nitratireducens]|uniref:alpha-D-ribose 1-methylphosphonate 5-triphosphate diphosphatase n=1 Tax=Nioella nitratireducens TaxID=1287720 RepID=UPI0008FD06AF|nr:alpha-D-ribose 1-methylphosphonate 5-triphosphate diphosphatase [Nioella nitratireducens]